MSLPFDATLKTLLERYPEDWLRLTGLDVTGPVTVINADTSTFSSQADKVIHVGGDRPWIHHNELQATRDDSLESRTLYGSVAISERHGLPVKSVVTLLRPQAEEKRKPLTGMARRVLPDEGSYLEFRYTVVRLWQLPPDTLLNAGLGLLPLAPLTKVTQRELSQVVRRMKQRLAAETDKATAADLWVATYVLMGLRYPEALTVELLKGVRGLEESVTYQAIIKIGEARGLIEGEARGKARGKAEGKAEEALKMLLRVGRKRLGEPDAPTLAYLSAVTDVERLETLVERVLEIENWIELFAPPSK